MDNNKLFSEMIAYYTGDPKRIQHFTKVTAYANLIAQGEKMDSKQRKTLEAAALTHDIGIKISEEKYGSCSGKYQEKEGPAIAREMLEKLGYDSETIERVCYLIAHHHTYKDIQEQDYQILVEADFLVNMYEDQMPVDYVEKVLKKIFKTETGKRICKEMYGI